jgi:hypothetical protein
MFKDIKLSKKLSNGARSPVFHILKQNDDENQALSPCPTEKETQTIDPHLYPLKNVDEDSES